MRIIYTRPGGSFAAQWQPLFPRSALEGVARSRCYHHKSRRLAAEARGAVEGEKEKEQIGNPTTNAEAPPPAAQPPRLALWSPWARGKLDSDIFSIALPTLATLAADPLAGLVSTAWVGRLGAAELGAVGVALSVYNTSTKLLNVPLLSVTTSTVATALGEEQGELGDRVGTAVSAAVMLALLTGAVQALALTLFGVAGLGLWGAGPGSVLHDDAVDYLTLRALSTPATVLFLTLQGAFRGLGDTRAPFYATLLCNWVNIALEPLLIFEDLGAWGLHGLGWGVRGAAAAITAAQVLSCAYLLPLLARRCRLRLADADALRSSLDYLGPTGLAVIRTLCLSGTFAAATGIAARTDPIHAAAHQVCFQIWLASSLLSDSLAVAAQALLARMLAAGDKQSGKAVVERTAALGLWLGAAQVAGLAAMSPFLPRLFTEDPAVLATIGTLFPAVVATQPLNSIAFVGDGILFGVRGFQYAATSMAVAVAPALGIMFLGPQLLGPWAASEADAQLYAVWAALASVMLMRILLIYWPYSTRLRPFDQLAG